MGSIDFLRCNLKQFLSLQGEWSEISAKAKTIINNSLTNLKEIKFSYQGDELFFDTSCISDYNTLNVLKLT